MSVAKIQDIPMHISIWPIVWAQTKSVKVQLQNLASTECQKAGNSLIHRKQPNAQLIVWTMRFVRMKSLKRYHNRKATVGFTQCRPSKIGSTAALTQWVLCALCKVYAPPSARALRQLCTRLNTSLFSASIFSSLLFSKHQRVSQAVEKLVGYHSSGWYNMYGDAHISLVREWMLWLLVRRLYQLPNSWHKWQ